MGMLDAELAELFRTVLRDELRQMNDKLDLAVRRSQGDARSDELLTLSEASSRAKVHPVTLRRWIKDGRLPARRAGRLLRILWCDLERCLVAASGGNVDLEELAETTVQRMRGARG
jgi:excisionase family DNA binding protein